MKTIQELIEFCEAIPEENWCVGQLEWDSKGLVKRCIAGHLNHHITGNAFSRSFHHDEPCRVIFESLGLSRHEMVDVNNWAFINSSPKKSVISYLQKVTRREVA